MHLEYSYVMSELQVIAAIPAALSTVCTGGSGNPIIIVLTFLQRKRIRGTEFVTLEL